MKVSLKLGLLLSSLLAGVECQTPPNFKPAVSSPLTVTYGEVAANPAGQTLPAAALSDPPSLAGANPGKNTFVVIMLDLSVNLGDGQANTTLLHWIISDLTATNKTLTTSTAAIAPYFPPGPPAGQRHTYVLLAYRQPEKFAVPTSFKPYFANLTASVFNRVGFPLANFTAEAKLGNPLAADWFLVSTPSTNTSSSSSTPTTTGTSSGTGPSITTTSTNTNVPSSTSASPSTLQTVGPNGSGQISPSGWVLNLSVIGLLVWSLSL